MEHALFINAGFEQPVMAQYQSPEIHELYNKYYKEAEAQGMDKKNQIEKYIQKYVKPTTECTDVPDNAYTTCEGETQTVVSSSGRGNVRPIWTKVLNHFQNRKGI
jgi:hypothetical protein